MTKRKRKNYYIKTTHPCAHEGCPVRARQGQRTCAQHRTNPDSDEIVEWRPKGGIRVAIRRSDISG